MNSESSVVPIKKSNLKDYENYNNAVEEREIKGKIQIMKLEEENNMQKKEIMKLKQKIKTLEKALSLNCNRGSMMLSTYS